MPKEYTREEVWKLYEKLPKELQEAIFSEETADNIWNICERNEISEEKISEIAKQVGNVLLGILPPEEFQKILEKEIKLKKEIAKKVFHEIYRFIFAPVKESLAELYKIEIPPPEIKPSGVPPSVKPSEISPPEAPLLEEEPEAPKKPDIYREPIE